MVVVGLFRPFLAASFARSACSLSWRRKWRNADSKNLSLCLFVCFFWACHARSVKIHCGVICGSIHQASHQEKAAVVIRNRCRPESQEVSHAPSGCIEESAVIYFLLRCTSAANSEGMHFSWTEPTHSRFHHALPEPFFFSFLLPLSSSSFFFFIIIFLLSCLLFSRHMRPLPRWVWQPNSLLLWAVIRHFSSATSSRTHPLPPPSRKKTHKPNRTKRRNCNPLQQFASQRQTSHRRRPFPLMIPSLLFLDLSSLLQIQKQLHF